jgi:murein L,D-transpeptidase YcbB/YkuD
MMLPTIAATLAMGALAWAGGPDSAPTHKPVPVSKTPTAVIRKTSVSPSTARPAAVKRPATGATATARRSSKAPVVRTTWRTRQTAPTPDRYREIQEALAARGYLSADDANGTWGPSSTEALKRFQAEQSLESSGRIDSLSLIALGLGPKHDSAALVPRTVDANVQSELGHN